MNVDYYPPLGFYFKVTFNQATSAFSPSGHSWGFQSLTGLTSEVVTETYKEGGQNQYEYELPVKTQYPDLVLKRGLYIPTQPRKLEGGPRELLYWFQEMMESLIVKRTNINIFLLNPGPKRKRDQDGNAAQNPGPEILMAWQVHGAWPKKWQVADFNAEEGQLMVETMEFHYDYFRIIKVNENYARTSA